VTDRLHHDEVPIDRGLARRLLGAQFPAFADLPMRMAQPQGTDNVVIRLGTKLSVRLPRKSSAVPSLLLELDWLPRLAPSLPLEVPMPIAAGQPGEGYPFPWSVCRWVDGAPPRPEDLDGTAARVLGEFVLALQSHDTSGGPPSEFGTNRGGPLAAYDEVTRSSLDEVLRLMASGRLEADFLDAGTARAVWDAAVAAPAWDRPGVWLHRDLHCGNLLAAGGRLTGVIDFGGLVVGDPAGNAMAAWHVLEPGLRAEFRSIVGADDPTWTRARGWALSQGLLALPYYLDTHPGMVLMARRAITATLVKSGHV
jgi:aminoglycoside phosphotransferase (APT) family kinase protein